MNDKIDSPANGRITGVIPAVITPFTAERMVDFAGLERQTAYLSEHDISGLFVAGTTGEGYGLSTAEKIEIFRQVKSAARDDLKLFAACLEPTSHQVIAEMNAFAPLKPNTVHLRLE